MTFKRTLRIAFGALCTLSVVVMTVTIQFVEAPIWFTFVLAVAIFSLFPELKAWRAHRKDVAERYDH